jgi:hypothetical protein
MAKDKWEELLVWTYVGPRFQERGIELRDLAPLVLLRELLAETARHVWLKRNPSRQRLSPKASKDLELRIFGFEAGSCCITIHFAPPQPTYDQVALFADVGVRQEEDDGRELANALPEAAWLLSDALAHLLRVEPLSGGFPDELLPDLKDVLGSVQPDTEVHVRIPEKKWPDAYEAMTPMAARSAVRSPINAPSNDVSEVLERGRVLRTVRFDAALLEKVKQVVASKTRVSRTVTGEVTMASLKGKAAIDVDGRDVRVTFPPQFVNEITLALHKHESLRIRVRGDGEVDLKTGRLQSLDVTDREILQRPDPNTPSTSTFERWAIDDPTRLLAILTSAELKPTALTFAAEIAGARLPRTDIVPPLLALLHHSDSAVREGAIYGLAYHSGQEIDKALHYLAENDPSPGVREAAAATLENR